MVWSLAPGSGPLVSVAARALAPRAWGALARRGEEGVQALAAPARPGAAPRALAALARWGEEAVQAWAPRASAAPARQGAPEPPALVAQGQ